MKWRELFAEVDEYIKDLRLMINRGEILIEKLRRLKSEEWYRHYENGGKEADNGQMESKRTGQK